MTSTATSNYNKPLLAFIGVCIFWLFLVFDSLWSAVGIWLGNEIYNHCLIVIPASIYLIYEKRYEIDWGLAKMSWLALIFFVGQLLLFILGGAADIQLFQHVAVFSMLPTIVWLFIGDRLAWSLQFPLAFVLFSVPVGEELIPFLQEITADISVFMLESTGIPLFRSGLFIEIPQGKFLVAEACSGVSFLIASIVLGNLYAYMNLVSWQRRTIFVFLSILFPILANAVRVYGIIYIGYSTDMEHAVGADHLIYGWFFFAFVLVCLFFLGEVIRRNELKRIASKTDEVAASNERQSYLSNIVKHYVSLPILTIVIFTIGMAKFQDYRISNVDTSTVQKMNINLDGFAEMNHSHQLTWEPRFLGNTESKKYHLSNASRDFDLYYAYFNGEKGEIVSSLNRLYEQDRWTLVESSRMNSNDLSIQRQTITSSVGISKEIAFWYVVDGSVTTSFTKVKMLQLLQKLKGLQSHAFIVILSIESPRNKDLNEGDIASIIDDFVMKQRLQLN